MTTYGKLFEDALLYATTVHDGQTRKGSGIPYITHLLAVASIVGENGGTESEVAAALLHDAIEDTQATKDSLTLRFGEDVAQTVLGCSDADASPGDEKPPWRKRKEDYIAHIAGAPASVRLVSAADKLHNARTILADYRAIHDDLWGRFKGGRDGTLWYYRSLVREFEKSVDDPRTAAVTEELHRTVKDLHDAAGEKWESGDAPS